MDLLFIELMSHLSHVKEMYSQSIHLAHELILCILKGVRINHLRTRPLIVKWQISSSDDDDCSNVEMVEIKIWLGFEDTEQIEPAKFRTNKIANKNFIM